MYIFCGIQNQTKKYFSSIERINMQTAVNNVNAPWEVIHCKNTMGVEAAIPARQGVGTAQFASNQIMIMGGFGGKYFRDCWILNTNTNVLSQNDEVIH